MAEEDRSFFDHYEFVKAAQADGSEAFLCYGSGGFGAVFAAKRKGDAASPTLAVKVIVTNEAAAKKMFEREFKELLRLKPLILADEKATATIIMPEDAFLSSLSSGGLIIHLVMEASAVARPFAFPAAPGETFPNISTMRAMRSQGSGCDMTDNPIARPPLTQGQARHVMRQVLQACSFFHRNGILHRDIKPDNLIVFGSAADETTGEVYPLVKVSDFGLSRRMDPLMDLTKNVGTRSYRAPEVTGHAYTDKVDSFSCGCEFVSSCSEPEPLPFLSLPLSLFHLIVSSLSLRSSCRHLLCALHGAAAQRQRQPRLPRSLPDLCAR